MSSNPLALFLSRSIASPYAITLGLGLGSISFFFWGNLAGQPTGAIVIPVNPEVRRKLGIDTSKAVEIWKWAYIRGAVSTRVLPHPVFDLHTPCNNRPISVYLA
jgi:hypothetical protein